MLKLGVEVVLMLVFLATAVLRSALAKQDLVDAQLLSPESLTVEEKRMPKATACPRPVRVSAAGRKLRQCHTGLVGFLQLLRPALACEVRARTR